MKLVRFAEDKPNYGMRNLDLVDRAFKVIYLIPKLKSLDKKIT